MRLVWATRGRTWGFRFVDHGGLAEPLDVYEDLFGRFDGEREVLCRSGDRVAVRFADPEGRTDAAGRVIPHDFVVLGPRQVVDEIDSVDAGRRIIWPEVADRYDLLWNESDPATG